MKKILTHWTFAFVTLFALTWIGLQDPQIKEILRLKSFDLLFQSQDKEVSQDIAIVTIDEKAIEVYGQWPWKRDKLAEIIEELRAAEVGVIVLIFFFVVLNNFFLNIFFLIIQNLIFGVATITLHVPRVFICF